MQPIIRPAKRNDVIAFQGEPYDQSFRGIVVELDDEIIGLAGVLHSNPLQAFSVISDTMRKYPKCLVLAARDFRKYLDMYDSPIYAMANPDEKNSEGYLEYVGFEKFDESKRLYKWQQQSLI